MDSASELSVRKQCEALDISRSSLYYSPNGESVLNLELMKLLDQHFLEYPTYGVLQMQDYLLSEGYQVNEKRVRRLLRKMSIMAIYVITSYSIHYTKLYDSDFDTYDLEVGELNRANIYLIRICKFDKEFLSKDNYFQLREEWLEGLGSNN